MMSRSERLKLAFAIRHQMSMIDYSDQVLMLTAFDISYIEDPERTIDDGIGRSLLGAKEDDLIALADHVEASRPGIEPQELDVINPFQVDAYTELVAAETVLRDAVRLVLGEKWKDNFSETDIAKLEAKQIEEDKRRDGVSVSSDLLDYTETYHLKTLIIDKHWNEFKPVLDDKNRASAYFGIILDIRNTIAHSRPVVPAERLLIAGAAGQLQNQLAQYRSQVNGPDAHYASINYIRDSFGEELAANDPLHTAARPRPRLNVGDRVFFECSATDPRNRKISWVFSRTSWNARGVIDENTGNTATFEWVVSEADVGESRSFTIEIRNSSKFQRTAAGDDRCTFSYNVNPPRE
ncbi:hypothetical protein [Nocardia sp. NPDC050175]|uniref:hypothetical protein n=1 Tax=Nocardia sp. NPDC050175 TaxID=3364317 RepID=UPI0037ADB30B